MDNQLHDLLLKLDNLDCESIEQPLDFNFEKASQEVENVKPRLEKILGRKLKILYEQDATFSVSLYFFLKDVPPKVEFCFRFSAFGNLVSFYPCMIDGIEGDFNKCPVNSLISELGKAGFTYVSYEDLKAPYGGVFETNWPKKSKLFPTWWIRFFDYY